MGMAYGGRSMARAFGARFAIALVLGLAWSAAAPAWAVDAAMRWVEVEVALSPDMKAMVQYKVCWNVSSGTMGGFYFQGERARIAWHAPGCGAVVNGQNRYRLDIRDLGDRWDVLLAEGQRFGPGEIVYVMTYFADYGQAGHLEKTHSPEHGDLVVFHWAPVEWDSPLEHETVSVRFPIPVEKEEMTLEEVTPYGLLTEPFVNERYRLSYFGRRGAGVSGPSEPEEGERFLVVRAHADSIRTRDNFRLQYYVPARYFTGEPALDSFSKPLIEGASAGASSSGYDFSSAPALADRLAAGRRTMTTVTLGLLGFVAAMALYKHRSMIGASERMEAIRWDRDDWAVPKIELRSFRKNGKVAKLNAIEAGYLCDIPLRTLVGLMLFELEQYGVVAVSSRNPLRIDKTGKLGDGFTPYHRTLLDCIEPDGELASYTPAYLVRALTGGIQEKSWDCDLEATREHYKKEFERQFQESNADAEAFWTGRKRAEEIPPDSRYRTYYPFFHTYYQSDQYEEVYAQAPAKQIAAAAPDPEGLASQGYSYFLDGRFDSTDVAASYAASACHSACHSACVSGGAH